MAELGPVLALVALFLLVLALMAWGWRRRGRSQQHLPAPTTAALEELGETTTIGPLQAVYVSTVLAQQPLERVVAHTLGQRASARVSIGSAGTWHILREGTRPLAIPADAVSEITAGPGMAGKFVGGDGILILRWRLGDQLLDTGLRLARREDHDLLLSRKEHP
ncbi:PH-like domain-containing protein [Brachybacterium alimentarium]|uniref:PH-like domain-containing protein n=1 Tax=Brachybacterium alimentarium TaxID=47845 RepID=UPI003FD50B5E